MQKDKNIQKLIELKIREVPNWPKQGVSFKDFTPLLGDGKLFCKTINIITAPYKKAKIDKVVGIDARGFILAAACAYKLKTGLAIVRKKGKLPSKTISQKYALEYGENILEMHQDSILPGEKVIIVDDVLATGGTMAATASMVKKLGGKILGIEFLIELDYLNGRENLKGQKVKSILNYK